MSRAVWFVLRQILLTALAELALGAIAGSLLHVFAGSGSRVAIGYFTLGIGVAVGFITAGSGSPGRNLEQAYVFTAFGRTAGPVVAMPRTPYAIVLGSLAAAAAGAAIAVVL